MHYGAGVNLQRFEKARLPLLFIFLVALSFWAYKPIFFDYFLGDDFVNLDWAERASRDPHLVACNFYQNWLNIATTKFYRPLTSVTFYIDYMIWKENGLGYHITNVALHALSTCFTFLICRKLAQANGHKNAFMFPSVAAALFAVHPVHPEVVAWITGRVDGLVTCLYLIALWFYMRWRTLGGTVNAQISFAFLIASLMSKESAISLPAVCLAFDFFVMRKEIKKIFPPALWFALIIAGYLIVRKLALGTFVGGYNSSVQDWSVTLAGWKGAFNAMLFPVNAEIIGSSSTTFLAWKICLALSIAITALRSVRDSAIRGILLLLTCWWIFSLAPLFRIMYVGSLLDGSRHLYLASVPVSIITALQCFPFKKERFERIVRAAAILCICCLLAAGFRLLQFNNTAWEEAGLESQLLKRSFATLLAREEKSCFFFNVPDSIHGAYIARNGFGGLTKGIRCPHGHISNDNFHPSIGFLKNELVKPGTSARLLYWDRRAKRFVDLEISKELRPYFKTWSGPEIQNILQPVSGTRSLSKSANSYQSSAENSAFEIKLERRNPWELDLISVELDNLGSSSKASARTAKGDIVQRAVIEARNKDNSRFANVYTETRSENGRLRITFPCYRNADWLALDEIDKLYLVVIGSDKLSVKSFSVLDQRKCVPSMRFADEKSPVQQGIITLTSETPNCLVLFDCTKIADAESCQLQLSENGQIFSERTMGDTSPPMARTIPLKAVSGSCRLELKDFSGPGLYSVRVVAMDRLGKITGYPSDNLTVIVSK